VTVVPLPTPELGADRVLCEGDTLLLEVPVTAAAILWSTGALTPSIALTTTTPVTVTYTLENCRATDDLQVYFLPPVIELAAWTDSTYCPGEQFRLDAFVPFGTYAWNDGHEGSNHVITTTGTYSVTVRTPCAVLERSIDIGDGECAPLVNIPNAFTPDGDGINDVFRIVLSAEPLDLELLIFDRWGEQLFSSTDPAATWDGTYNGTPAQDGVYVYQVTYRKVADTGVVSEKLRGHVTLLR
jgi:gliding motility-associated-like protein